MQAARRPGRGGGRRSSCMNKSPSVPGAGQEALARRGFPGPGPGPPPPARPGRPGHGGPPAGGPGTPRSLGPGLIFKLISLLRRCLAALTCRRAGTVGGGGTVTRSLTVTSRGRGGPRSPAILMIRVAGIPDHTGTPARESPVMTRTAVALRLSAALCPTGTARSQSPPAPAGRCH